MSKQGEVELLAFKRADTLSESKQDVLRTSSIRRLQNTINDAINTRVPAQPAAGDVVRDIVERWASSDPDAIDDLDALCRIAEVLDVEVKERNATPEPESY